MTSRRHRVRDSTDREANKEQPLIREVADRGWIASQRPRAKQHTVDARTQDEEYAVFPLISFGTDMGFEPLRDWYVRNIRSDTAEDVMQDGGLYIPYDAAQEAFCDDLVPH